MAFSFRSPIKIKSIPRLGVHELERSEVIQIYARPEDGSRFYQHDSFELHYRDHGPKNAPVILMSHGICDSLHTWDAWCNHFQEYRVIRFDLPGFALSRFSTDELYNAETLVTAAESLLNFLEVEKVHVVGNSLGGFLSWNFAIQKPMRTLSLTMLDPAGYKLDKLPWMIAVADAPVLSSIASKVTPKPVVVSTLLQLFGDFRKIKLTEIDRLYTMMMCEGNRSSYMHVFREMKYQQDVDMSEVRKIKCPTLLIWGEKDRWIPVQQAQLWSRDIPHIEVEVMKGVGHMPQLESPAESAAHYLRFLNTHFKK